VDVRIVVKEVTKLLRSTIPATIDIRETITVEPIVVLADPAWIHQILMNLCTNAHHAMESGAGILTVSLDGIDVTDGMLPGLNLSPGPYARLRVSDTGRGIHASIRERIFEPYFSTKEIGKGNGLGLSIVHGIVRNVGGAIRLESEPGKGSAFNVYLPRSIENKDRHDEIGVAPKILPGAGERLLLVDDEISIVEIQKEMLSFHGYEVVGVADSQTALEIFKISPARFDAVITDYTMPRMTGLDMARRMMAINPEIPVLMCSGFNERIKEENLRASGIRKFFLKPVTMSILLHGLREVLDGAAH
jgi:CheY-like chemotaxis protein